MSGIFTTTFTSNIAAGDEQMVADYTVTELTSSCNDGEQTREVFVVVVEVPGLIQIPNHPDVSLVLTSPFSHDGSVFWFLTPETIESTIELGRVHRDNYSAPVVLTAASLVKGGINDIQRNWAPKHTEHRIGSDIDIDDQLGNESPERFWALKRLGDREAGFFNCNPEDGDDNGVLDHVHCQKKEYE